MKSKRVHTILRYVLALGTIGYGVVSMSRTKRFAELTNMEETDVHDLAMRDIASGLQLLTATNPGSALVSLALHDFKDGARLLKSRPSVASIAFLGGIVAVAAILTRPRTEEAG